jgi:hypothetical protein
MGGVRDLLYACIYTLYSRTCRSTYPSRKRELEWDWDWDWGWVKLSGNDCLTCFSFNFPTLTFQRIKLISELNKQKKKTYQAQELQTYTCTLFCLISFTKVSVFILFTTQSVTINVFNYSLVRKIQNTHTIHYQTLTPPHPQLSPHQP